ncbi:MAG: N-acetyl-gamma-glutamyl-phosphate reductase [Myxococcota bacterium]
MKVGVVGVSGYAGSELCRWLLEHPSLELSVAVGRSAAGQRLDEVHPGLGGLTALEVEAWEPEVVADCDVVCLAVPHGQARALAEAVPEGVRIADLSADHRHADGWLYGLVDWTDADFTTAERVAVPGCFATAIALALAPFAAAEAIRGPVTVSACTGSTGSGATPGRGTHHPERAVNLRAYKMLRHQHVPEIEATLAAVGQPADLVFVPLSAPVDRGILATAFVPVRSGLDPVAVVREAYADAALVRLRDESPHVRHVRGTAFADLWVGQQHGHAVVISAIDNLGKGAATQAVQCLNRMAGLPAHTGLRRSPSLP